MTDWNNRNQVATFVFETKFPVRSVDRNEDPWFVAMDVCAALGLGSHRVAVRKLDEDEKGVCLLPSLGGDQGTTIISESGLYVLVLRCDDAVHPGSVAHRFRKWVTNDVLPAIRKTGRYEAPGAEKSQMNPKLAEMAAKAAIAQNILNTQGKSAARRAQANLGLLEDLGLTRFVDENEGGPKRAPSKRGRPHSGNIGLEALARIFDAPVDREPVGRIVRRAFDEDLDAHNLLKKIGIRVEPDGALLIATGEKLWVGRLFRKETPCCARRLVHIPSAAKTTPRRFGGRTQYRSVCVPAAAVQEMLATLNY